MFTKLSKHRLYIYLYDKKKPNKITQQQACRKSHFKQSTCTQGKSLIPYITGNRQQLSNLNMSSHFAISQYPRPSVFPSQYPDSDRPLRRDIKIMGYSLRFSHFRYTIWLEFNAITFKRSESDERLRCFFSV